MSKFCSKCGNELMEESVICPKCGCPVVNSESVFKQDNLNSGADDRAKDSSKGKYNLLSIIGIVLAGVSLLLNFWGIVGIAAVIISSIALVQIKNTNEKGKALAVVGISVGGFSILYAAIILVMAML